MPEINILPKEIYQLIAAGEVVERPSSIVKEMIENSIDAGAKSITVEIRNGGTTYIRITDDGCGIERTQVKKVFISHATSKISKKDDLNSIATLGFRGEAMASIAAVSKVELLTREETENIGTRYEIAGGEEICIDDAGCTKGTTIVIRDIFFNTPARMKFLKKDVTEGNSVAGVVDRMAISHPEVSFRFIRDGKQVLITSGNGELKSAIYSVFGKEAVEGLLEIDYTYENMRVSGFASKPTSSRKSRAMQFFFINSRLVKSATAMAALEQAYKNSIMVGRFPMCVLNIELNPALVDVNVHPAKIEVRFANEKPIFELIYYGVKAAVENDRTVKEAHLPQEKQMHGTVARTEQNYSAKLDFFKKKEAPPIQQTFSTSAVKRETVMKSAPASYEPEPIKVSENKVSAEKSIEKSDTASNTASADNIINTENTIEKIYNLTPRRKERAPRQNESVSPQNEREKTTVVQEQSDTAVTVCDEDKNDDISFRLVGEAFKTYLIVEIDKELYFIDKHAAHERMNYEAFKANATVEVQMLLSPVAVNLSKEEFTAITDNSDLLLQCGFETEEFGESSIIVRAVPSLVGNSDIEDLITEIAQKLLEHKTDITPDKIDWIYHSASCRGAVKAGDFTSPQEQEMFVKKLLSMPEIRFCPHGRPVFIKLSKYDIEKQFGRV